MRLKKTCLVLCIVLFPFSFVGAMEEKIQDKPVKQEQIPLMMGIELELQDIAYVNSEDIEILDHIRLFESEKKDTYGKPNWYLEVDGNGNIEFVSRPMELETESQLLIESVKEMNRLVQYLLFNSKAIQGQEPCFLFVGKRNDTFKVQIQNQLGENKIGTFVHKKPIIGNEELLNDIPNGFFTIKIFNPHCFVRPQATFQIPLSNMQNFVNYMGKSHKALFMAIARINKCTVPKVSNHGQGLAHLVMITSELLGSNYLNDEFGPKGVLTLMSRGSFSKMYAGLNEQNQHSYMQYIDAYLSQNNKDTQLFKQPYALFCVGKDISQVPIINQYINKITIADFFNSVVSPNSYKDRFDQSVSLLCDFLRDKFEELKILFQKESTFEKKQELKKDLKSIEETIQNVKKGDASFQNVDLLSPPPFLTHTYSLGKYKNVPNNTAIIEMRGYCAGFYRNKMQMGNLVLSWLTKEIVDAGNGWTTDSRDKYKNELAQTEENYRIFRDKEKLQLATESMAKIERWLWLGKMIKDDLTQQLQQQNNLLFSSLYSDYNNFYDSNHSTWEKLLFPGLYEAKIKVLEKEKEYMLKFLTSGF